MASLDREGTTIYYAAVGEKDCQVSYSEVLVVEDKSFSNGRLLF